MNRFLDLAPQARWLRFPPDIEKAFREDYYRGALTTTRAALILAIVLYACFAVLDLWGAPITRLYVWGIRSTVVCCIGGVLALSFTRHFRPLMQPVLAVTLLIAGLGIVGMIAIARPEEPSYRYYYVGLLLVVMWGYTFVRVRFLSATFTNLGIVAAYEAVAITRQDALSSTELWLFVNNNFFLVSANIIGMFAGYFLEVYTRRDFVQRLAIQFERNKSEGLLLSILPQKIAGVLKDGEKTVADQFNSASILFADVVDFTPLSAELKPNELVEMLNEIFTDFDALVDKYGLEKIKTIGDCYMVAAGVPTLRADHAHPLADLALEMLEYVRNPCAGHLLTLRIGINSGPVVAGVIGRRKFAYDLWGDTVNVASRMESCGEAGRIQITRTTYDLIKDDFICKARGAVLVKGRGHMEVWHVLGRKGDPLAGPAEGDIERPTGARPRSLTCSESVLSPPSAAPG